MTKHFDRYGISDFEYHANTYVRDGRRYSVTSLIEASKNEEVFELDLRSIDLGISPWGTITIQSFANHVRRINQIPDDEDYPIILDNIGFICDGWHRVAKAVINNKKTIKAVRLRIMPEPIGDNTK